MLREDKDSNRVVAMASPSHIQVEITEVQKLENRLTVGNLFCREKNAADLKRERWKRDCGFPRQRGRERRCLTLFWFPGSLTALPVVEFWKCLLILFSFNSYLKKLC